MAEVNHEPEHRGSHRLAQELAALNSEIMTAAVVFKGDDFQSADVEIAEY